MVCAGVSLALLVYECRKDVFVRWVAGAFLLFHVADLLDRELALRSFANDYPWVVRLLAWAGSIAATVFVAGLPISVRRLTLIVRDATRSRDNELRLIAAAESSADSVILYDSVYDAAGEICDFKFIFLNGNAERMIGMNRSLSSATISTRSSPRYAPPISSIGTNESPRPESRP